jgi:hypothetical protein
MLLFYELPDILKVSCINARFAVWKEQCHPKLAMPPLNISVRFNALACSDFSTDSIILVNNVDVTIFLVSLKAGGVALNLTEASRVYLMDSWWNPAVSTPSTSCFVSDEPFQLQVEYRMPTCFIEE